MSDPTRKNVEGFQPIDGSENLVPQEIVESSVPEVTPNQSTSAEEVSTPDQQASQAPVDAASLSIESALEPAIVEKLDANEKREEEINDELYRENDIKTDDSGTARDVLNKIIS